VNVHSFALPLAYLGATLGVAMVLPQLSRTIRNPGLAGVSALSWGLTALACLTWLSYGLRTAAMPQIPSNILLAGGAVAVVLLVPSATSRGRRALALVTAGTLIAALATVLPPQTIGYLAFAIGLLSVWPQLLESFANWRSGGESGLSLTTWSVKLAASSCWLAYALIATDLPVAVASAFGLTTNIAVFGMEASLRLRGARHAEVAVDQA
jgi:uncharacterized protein with PQ loop repeat